MSSGDLSAPLQNRFACLSVEPCMEDCTLVDIENNDCAFNSKNESLIQNTDDDIKKSGTLVSSLQNNIDIVVQDPVILKAKTATLNCVWLSPIVWHNVV